MMRISFIAGVIGAALLLSGCGGSYDAEKMYWQVSKKYQGALKDPAAAVEKDFNGAAAALRDIVAKYPAWNKAAELQFHLAGMYAVRKDSATAAEEFMKVAVNFPDKHEFCARALFAVGAISEQQGDWAKARELYRQIAERYPTTAIGLQIPLHVARYYQQLNLFDESRRGYTAALHAYLNLIEKNPYSDLVPALQYLVTVAYANQNRWDEAAQTLENMAAKYPKSEGASVALYRAAMIYQEVLKQPSRAIATYRKIISDYPQSRMGKNARLAAGSISFLQGDIEEAREEFDRIFEQYPEDTSLCAMAQLAVARGYEKADKWPEALKEYEKLMDTYPDTIEALQVPLLIARHHLRGKKFLEGQQALAKAVAWYGERIAKKPGDRLEAAARELTATAYGMQAKWDKALRELSELRRRYPQDPRSQLALLTMGVIYYEELKDPGKAVEFCRRFAREYPDHTMVPVAKEIVKQIQEGKAK